MKTRHEPLRMTTHARERCDERRVPTIVLEALRTHAREFLGQHAVHRRMKLRIVRQGDTYWIAPHVHGDLITVYAKDQTELRAWANNYLVNPTQNWHRLALLPNLRTTEEAITDELMALWAMEA